MTLPNPGVSLSILQIYNEAQAYPSGTWYNKGYGLGAYRGVQWWKDDTSTGFFPSGAISINDFYSKRPTTPVSAGSLTATYYSITAASKTGSTVTLTYNSTNQFAAGYTVTCYNSSLSVIGSFTILSTPASNQISFTSASAASAFNSGFVVLQTFVVPLYSNLSIIIRGGSGGGAGASGNVATGGNGGDGGASSFGAYGSGDYGRGGQVNAVNGTAGAGSDGTPAGGAGADAGGNGTNGGNGGAGGKTTLALTNPVSGGSGPSVGASVNIAVGNRGNAGFGGQFFNGFTVLQLPSGAFGNFGSIFVQWT